MKNRFLIAVYLSASFAAAQTVTLQGTVLSVSGAPIQGATCQFKSISNKAVTDAQGKYAFNGTVGIRQAEGYSIAMASQGRRISLHLDRGEQVALDLFNVSGKLIRAVAQGEMSAGSHTLDFATPDGAHQLYLLRVKLGSEIAWHKVAIRDGMASLSDAASASLARPLAKSQAVADSLFCTSPGYHGGLAKINGRAVSAYTGTVDIRMFSSDPAWKTQCAPPITFNFDNTAGVAKYKSLVPDWVASEQEVLMEVCQSVFKKPTEPKKYTSYIANIKSMDGVANTGGNTLNFSTEYINGQPSSYKGWWEVIGVQTHEATHSYQPYYNTTGAAGFGEAMPDAVRALNGFFSWPKGTRCSGGFAAVYQDGGKYWYYIEMKHPGFLTTVWQQTAGDISARVQSITGESLASLSTECEAKGMP
ncbi:MAG: Peptidase of plants and bacteria [Fibrobacteres bacterium]|nr:Peptidase of plants and bacteria [Fibrobacterota bacterium]